MNIVPPPAEAPKRRRLKREDRERMIVERAIEFFAEVGFAGQTRELAQRIGVTQPLLYRYFPTKEEASEAGEAASQRKGLISALPVRRVDEIPYAQLRWIVGNMHVGTSDDDLKADIKGRAKSGMTANPDLLAQACAYALASHRANQGLVAHFRL